MSCELVRSISRRKDGRVFITSASSNVWPKNYSRWEYMPSKTYSEKEVEDRMLHLFHGIIGQSYQFNETVGDNWKYALNKFYEYCNENDIHTYNLWELPYKDGGYDITVLKPYYDKFNEFYEEKIEGKYYLDSSSGPITKIYKKSFYTNRAGMKGVISGSYKKIYNELNRFSKDMIDYYDIKIKDYALEHNKDDNLNNQMEGDLVYE